MLKRVQAVNRRRGTTAFESVVAARYGDLVRRFHPLTHTRVNGRLGTRLLWWRQLRRKRPKGGQRSLREIAAELESAGHLNERGARYSAASVQHMIAQRG